MVLTNDISLLQNSIELKQSLKGDVPSLNGMTNGNLVNGHNGHNKELINGHEIELIDGKIQLVDVNRKKKFSTFVPPRVTLLELNDGHKIPLVGLGTSEARDQSGYDCIQWAIDAGYRHFDCAYHYLNEDVIGRALNDAIKSGKVTREELFVTTKVWPNWHGPGRPTQSVKNSLKDFGFDYLDLVLIHWPVAFKQGDNQYPGSPGQVEFDYDIHFTDVWRELEEVKAQGLTKSIGVSNFNSEQITQILDTSKTVPVVNQVECHPFFSQQKLKDFCQEHDIVLTAYSPLCRTGTAERKISGSPLDIPLVKDLAIKYHKTPAQICIKWQAQRGVVVIPKSVTRHRIYENIDLFDFDLTDEEINKMSLLNRNIRNNWWTKFGIDKHRDWPFRAQF